MGKLVVIILASVAVNTALSACIRKLERVATSRGFI
jgi:hypothetical protein